MCHGHLVGQPLTNYKSFDHSGAMLWGLKEKSSTFWHQKSSSFCAPQKRALQSFYFQHHILFWLFQDFTDTTLKKQNNISIKSGHKAGLKIVFKSSKTPHFGTN